MAYEYYDNQGKYVSRHNKKEVALRKKGGFVIDPQDYLVEVSDDGSISVRSIPGMWISVSLKEGLSNSAYHRCGVGTSWKSYWIKRKTKSVHNLETIDDSTSERCNEFVPIQIPSVRADESFNKQIKIPEGVGDFYMSVGKKDSFSSIAVKQSGGSPDFVTVKLNIDDFTPDLIIGKEEVIWNPGCDRCFGL